MLLRRWWYNLGDGLSEARDPDRPAGLAHRGAHLLWLAVSVISLSNLALGQTESDPWLILANGEKGFTAAHTTREDLVRMYGAANVLDQDVDAGDGERESETILFAKDPERRIEITWKDPKKTEPRSASIRGEKSRWHGIHGVPLGTTSRELEQLNGRPFRLSLLHDTEQTWPTNKSHGEEACWKKSFKEMDA